jgi:hypothetical protein
MPIVFDQVDGVIQPSAEASEAAPSAGGDKPAGGAELYELELQLEQAQRRRRRLLAD